MKKIAIIPARGGSKRIPKKNIKDFLGKPIIAYSIESALNSEIFDEVMVSTDDEKIAEIALKYGAKVPYLRSKELSNDTAPTLDVIIDVLKQYEKQGEVFDYSCCIYPTAPFVSSDILIKANDLAIMNDADCVLPVVLFSFPPQRGCIIENGHLKMTNPENFNKRSQDLDPIFHDAGQFYFLKSKSLHILKDNLYSLKTIPIKVPESMAQDIDNFEDFKIAEMKYKMMKK